jgi:hypothetical protein
VSKPIRCKPSVYNQVHPLGRLGRHTALSPRAARA